MCQTDECLVIVNTHKTKIDQLIQYIIRGLAQKGVLEKTRAFTLETTTSFKNIQKDIKTRVGPMVL